jgi:thiol-disulfide isomerase/thioredoxin
MKQLIFILTISFLLFSCGEEKGNATSSVTGNITNLAEGSSIYLDYLTSTDILTRDTAIIDANGNYAFHYPINDIGYYRLRINNQNFINLILDIGETPIINGDGSNLMDTYTVEGSKESIELKEFNLVVKADYLFQDSLNRYFQANQNDPNVFVEVKTASLRSENNLKAYYNKVIDENPGRLLSLAAVQQLDPEIYYNQFKKVDEALAKIISETPYYKTFHAKVEQLSQLNLGVEAPDFTLMDKDGKPISLSSLKGNIVLVDFWASWCRPCRAENPNVVKAYNKYHKKGFEVFSVSLDGMPQQKNPKEDWITAIEKDGLIWKNHVSDLKGWQSSVVPLYGIQGIPFTILIDKEGKIIAKNIRGAALEEKLEELF